MYNFLFLNLNKYRFFLFGLSEKIVTPATLCAFCSRSNFFFINLLQFLVLFRKFFFFFDLIFSYRNRFLILAEGLHLESFLKNKISLLKKFINKHSFFRFFFNRLNINFKRKLFLKNIFKYQFNNYRMRFLYLFLFNVIKKVNFLTSKHFWRISCLRKTFKFVSFLRIKKRKTLKVLSFFVTFNKNNTFKLDHFFFFCDSSIIKFLFFFLYLFHISLTSKILDIIFSFFIQMLFLIEFFFFNIYVKTVFYIFVICFKFKLSVFTFTQLKLLNCFINGSNFNSINRNFEVLNNIENNSFFKSIKKVVLKNFSYRLFFYRKLKKMKRKVYSIFRIRFKKLYSEVFKRLLFSNSKFKSGWHQKINLLSGIKKKGRDKKFLILKRQIFYFLKNILKNKKFIYKDVFEKKLEIYLLKKRKFFIKFRKRYFKLLKSLNNVIFYLIYCYNYIESIFFKKLNFEHYDFSFFKDSKTQIRVFSKINFWVNSWMQGALSNFYGLKRFMKNKIKKKIFFGMKKLPDVVILFRLSNVENFFKEMLLFSIPLLGVAGIHFDNLYYQYFFPSNHKSTDLSFFYLFLTIESGLRSFLKEVYRLY